jgi:hypothetical protein
MQAHHSGGKCQDQATLEASREKEGYAKTHQADCTGGGLLSQAA